MDGMGLLARLGQKLADLYNREPARSNAAIVTVVVALAAALGLVLSSGVIGVIGVVVALVAPELVAELTRPKVVPTQKIVDALPLHPADAGLMDVKPSQVERSARSDLDSELRPSGPDPGKPST